VTSATQDSVELQDLGNGQWRGVYRDRSILLTEREGKLATTLGQLASWAGMDRKSGSGPRELVVIAQTAIADGLIDPSDIPDLGAVQNGKNRKPYKDWAITRKAALLLMTRCRTPRAIELTRAMADVFEQWLDRRQRGASFSPDMLAPILVPISQALAALTRRFDQQNEELGGLRKEVITLSMERGIISDDAVLWISQQLKKITRLETGLSGKKMTPIERKAWQKALGDITSEARNEVCLPITRAWKKLNPSRLLDLQSFLELRLKRAEAKDKLREPLMDWARKHRN